MLGWSVGVLVATELARRHPARVSGLLLAAGVPGDLFGAMFGVLGLPVALRRALAYGGAHAIKAAAPLVDAVLHRIPANTATATLLQRVGLLAAGARPEEVAVAMRRFLQHDWRWYINLALAVGSLPVPHLDWITCPVTVLAGRYDLMADPNSTIRPFSCLPQARTRVIPATHLLPLEAPEVLAEELTLLVDRVAAVEQALAQGRPKRQPIDALIPPMLTYGSRRGA